MNIEDTIKVAMARMLERKLEIPNVTVNYWDEEFEMAYYTGCDTCGYGGDENKYIVYINYTYPELSYSKNFKYEASFAELIKELDTQ